MRGPKRGKFGSPKSNPRRHYRRNAVVPVSWNARRYRRNAVLPYFAMNPIEGIIEKAGRFVDVSFWTDTALPAAGGFIGSKLVGGMVYGLIGEKLLGVAATDAAAPWVRAGADALGTAVLSWGVGKFISKPMGEMVFLGGVVSIAHSILKALLGGTEIGKSLGLSGIGEDLTERMKEAVTRRLEAELSGVGAYLNENDLRVQMAGMNGVGEFVTETALRLQPDYGPTPAGDLRDYDVTRSETSI
jgi:hypothetical protein